jgi:TonB family protein
MLPVEHETLTYRRKVALQYRVTETGELASVDVAQSSGSTAADESVLGALRKCRFVSAQGDAESSRVGFLIVPVGPVGLRPLPTTPALARVRSNCAPNADDYPSDARRLNRQGTTVIRFTVGENSQLQRAEVVSSSGTPSLDHVAVSNLSNCPFRGGTDAQGKPRTSEFEMKFVWRLE